MLRRAALLTVAGLALVAVAAAACSGGGQAEPGPSGETKASQQLTQVAEAGGVTVEATWLTEGDLDDVDADVSAYPLREFILMRIGLDTHSGDLGEIDMEGTPLLRQQGAELPPEAWLSSSDASHHRAGVLVFPRELGGGPVELALEIGGEQVALLWQEPPAA